MQEMGEGVRKRRVSIPHAIGHLTGLKPRQVTRLERLYRRRVPVEKVISPELARSCTELSHEIRRQIGLLINRRGIIESVIIGTDRQLVIPELARSRSGPRLLRGVRFVHTHLNNQPLNKDDLTDLALLRLDLMAVLGVGNGGEPASISLAHLVPPNPQGKAYEAWAPQSLQAFQCRCDQFVQSLEAEISRATPALRRTDDGPSALLVSVTAERRPDQEERLRECQDLATSQGIQVVGTVMQRLSRINPKYVLGVGKITEVIIHALQSGADLLIFDRDLTPTQIKALSEMIELKVIDRTQLILDIFASRGAFTRRKNSSGTRATQVSVAQVVSIQHGVLPFGRRHRGPRSRRDQTGDRPETGAGSHSSPRTRVEGLESSTGAATPQAPAPRDSDGVDRGLYECREIHLAEHTDP